MPYYVLFHNTVKDVETFQKYPPAATATVMQYGGKLLAVAGPGMQEPTVLEGTPQHAVTALIEFESQAACERWYNSPEYRAVRGLRTSSTEGWVLCLPAFQPPAH
jgi:uncharacterized protein (DUF1330 family)